MFLCETLPPKVSLQKYMIYRWAANIFKKDFYYDVLLTQRM